MAKLAGDKSTPVMGPGPNVTSKFTPDTSKPFNGETPQHVPSTPQRTGFTNPWQAIYGGSKPKPSP